MVLMSLCGDKSLLTLSGRRLRETLALQAFVKHLFRARPHSEHFVGLVSFDLHVVG